MHSKKVQKIIWFFSLVNVLLLCVYAVLFYSINDNNKKTSEIYSSLYKKASEKEDLLFVERSLTGSVEKRKILESYFVKPDEQVAFIEQIEKLGNLARVDLKLSSVTPPKKTGDEFLLDFTAKGEFSNMNKLFALIDEMPYRISVQKANLSSSNSNDSFIEKVPMWSGTFTLVLESYLDK